MTVNLSRMDTTAKHLLHLVKSRIADRWAARVPTEEAPRILGYDLTGWSMNDRLCGLYDWKYETLQHHNAEDLLRLLDIEQEYLAYVDREQED